MIYRRLNATSIFIVAAILFSGYDDSVSLICSSSSNVTCQFLGYETLEKELNSVSTKRMKDLYFHWNDAHDCDLSFTCCPTIKPCTLSILDSFYLLATTDRTEIFYSVWKENLSLMSCHNSQEDIVQFVWKPTFKYCVELIQKLEHGKIALSEVERVFCSVQTLTDIQKSCESLVKVLLSCCSRARKHSISKFCSCECCTKTEIQQFLIHNTSVTLSSNTSWIQTVCKKIKYYRISQKCIKCAEALLILRNKDHLNLTGDFSSIPFLGEKV